MTTAADPRVQREYEQRLLTLFRFALANGLSTVDDIFARAASSGRLSAAELIAQVQQLASGGRSSELRDLVAELQPIPLRQLGALLAHQSWRPDAVAAATAVLEALAVHAPRKALTSAARGVLLTLLAEQARAADLDRFIAQFGNKEVSFEQAQLLRANASNPFQTGREDRSTPGVVAWLQELSRVFVRAGLEPFDLAPGSQAPVDRLLCAPSSLVEDGPLVSIVLAADESPTRLTTALASLLAQSYRRIEVLVVADATGATPPRWLLRDPRVRLVPSGGDLNAALDAATGDFLTFHPADGWSHPRRLEIQVADLLANPDRPAVLAGALAADPGLKFVRPGQAADLVVDDLSSLLIRRPVFDRIGFLDRSDLAGIEELRDRIAAAWGRPIARVDGPPLALLRTSNPPDSLEPFRGYVEPGRLWYRLASRAWHARTTAAGEVPHLPAGADVRPFPVPPQQASKPTAVDVLYATDFRFPGGNSTLACNEIQILLEHGYTVGLLQLDSPIVLDTLALHPRVFDLANHERARVLFAGARVSTPLTIVRHPTVAQFISPDRLPITTNKVVVIVNHAPVQPGGERAIYDIAQVVENCAAVFGQVPEVAPESALIRRLLDGRLDPALLATQDWNGVLGTAVGEPREAAPSLPPVLGRHSRDELGKWPTAADLPLVYPLDGLRDVRVLGGADHASERLGRPLGDAWTVYPFGSKPSADFLAELDFWVYFHGPDLYESFGMATLEAMAAGLVVVLPPAMKDTFGAGAVYCEPGEVQSVIDALWADPAGYRAQSENAIRTVRERFSAAALLARVEAAGLRPLGEQARLGS